jgi:DNA (cytosine-5)-methyltransferase 1
MPSADQSRAISALRIALAQFTREELAAELELDVRTLERYELDGIPKPKLVSLALERLLETRPISGSVGDPAFTFIDLFAGIGGTRLGFQAAGGQCVFTSEYEKYCQITYKRNHRLTHEVVGDIQEITSSNARIDSIVPDHDVLVAGFPCQPFSIAGVSKKNALGRAHGFECNTQGTLFFDICKVLQRKKPIAFMLENVRNILSHDGGKTFKVIMESLHELGYRPEARVLDAKAWVPQHRERVFIVGFREPTAFSFSQVEVPALFPKLAAVLHPEDGTEKADGKYTVGPRGVVSGKYTLSSHLWDYLKKYKAKHQAKGNGFGYSKVDGTQVARTLSHRYHKDGSEILVDRGDRRNPRRLTPRECARLMGFPDSFEIPVSDTQAYQQFGNSVVVPVVTAVAKAMLPHVVALKNLKRSGQAPLAL